MPKAVGRMSVIVIDVDDPRIPNVHVAEVVPASAIPRIERLTPTERAPTISATTTETQAHAPSRSAEPCDQRWRVKRPNVDRSRSPSPVAAGIDPAAVVEGRVTPRLVIYPGPAPRRNPHPMTKLIRSPSRSHSNRTPNPTVRRLLGPDSVVIQILIAHSSGRNIARRKGSIESLVPHRAPAIEAVVSRCFRHRVRH